MEDGYTKEEWKMVVETKKILDPKIKLTATCVRVPVFIGHSEAVNIEFENPISADEAREILRNAPGCLVIDKREDGGYITPHEAAGEDATYISRIREDTTVENGLALWCVSDNLRKGAALNAIQIAECVINRKLIRRRRRRRNRRRFRGRVRPLYRSESRLREHAAVVRAGHRAEGSRLRIEHREHAGRHVEIGAVQVQTLALDQNAHAGKRQQIVERVEHDACSSRVRYSLHRHVAARSDACRRPARSATSICR